MGSKRFYLGMAVAALVLTAGVASVSAYQGDYTQKGPNYSPERHEAMEEAFEGNDYAAWQELMAGRGRVTQVVNENNFAKFAEAHQLAQAGQLEEADAIRAELGLKTRDGERMGAGFHGGQGKGMGSGQRRGNGACPHWQD